MLVYFSWCQTVLGRCFFYVFVLINPYMFQNTFYMYFYNVFYQWCFQVFLFCILMFNKVVLSVNGRFGVVLCGVIF